MLLKSKKIKVWGKLLCLKMRCQNYRQRILFLNNYELYSFLSYLKYE